MKVRRTLRHFWQRITRGWDDGDIYHLGYTIAKFSKPRLILFKEKACSFGHPGNITSEEWDNIVDKMIVGTDLLIRDVEGEILSEEDHTRAMEGLELLGKWMADLWW